MRTYSSDDVKTYPVIFFLLLWLVFEGIFFLFLVEYNIFSCTGQYCRQQYKVGFFGRLVHSPSINRYDIVDIEVSSSYHYRSGKRSSSHYDYSPVLIMKDGTRYPLRLKYCRGKQNAIDLIVKIRGKKNFKETKIR